jgi:hypothetical protein
MKPTQAQRVLKALREAGDRGIHTFTLRSEFFIANPSERIASLERLGHVIKPHRERLNGEAIGCRYVLTYDAGDQEPVAVAVPVDSPTPSPPGGGDPDGHENRLFDIQPRVAGAYETAA